MSAGRKLVALFGVIIVASAAIPFALFDLPNGPVIPLVLIGVLAAIYLAVSGKS